MMITAVTTTNMMNAPPPAPAYSNVSVTIATTGLMSFHTNQRRMRVLLNSKARLNQLNEDNEYFIWKTSSKSASSEAEFVYHSLDSLLLSVVVVVVVAFLSPAENYDVQNEKKGK